MEKDVPFKFSKAELSEKLSRDLPFTVSVHLYRQGTAHTNICAYWHLDDGKPPHNLVPFQCELAFVDDDKRSERLNSGFAGTHIDDAFAGLGIHHIFTRNAMALFRDCGETSITRNPHANGAKVAQQMGFLARSEDLDLNDDEHDVFGNDWSPERVWSGHSAQCKTIAARLKIFECAGIVTPQQAAIIKNHLIADEPDAIWNFLDMADCISVMHAQIGHSLLREQERFGITDKGFEIVKSMIKKGEGMDLLHRLNPGVSFDCDDMAKPIKLSTTLMTGLKVACTFNFHSNVQMARFESATRDASINAVKFAEITAAYMAEERRKYSEEQYYDYLMSGGRTRLPQMA